MGIVASDALALGSGVRDFGLVDFLCLIAVARGAKGSSVGVDQNYFAVFGGRVAHVAGLLGKGRMRELLHQLGKRRLVRIVALETIGGRERLPLMRLDQGSILDVVAVHAKGWDCFHEMLIELDLGSVTGFVGDVAGVATHVESRVPTALRGYVQTLGVAIEAEILTLVATCGLEQLILVFGLVRVVTFDAIAHGGRMNGPLDARGVFISMAGETKRLRRGSDELHAGYVFVDPDLMTGQAAGGDGRVDGFAFCLVFMALDTLGGVGIRLERNGMDSTKEIRAAEQGQAQNE